MCTCGALQPSERCSHWRGGKGSRQLGWRLTLLAVVLVPVVGQGDNLDGREAARLEVALDTLKVRVQVLVPDGLEHLDRDDLVEAALRVGWQLVNAAVIAEDDVDPIGEPRSGDLGACLEQLLVGHGDAGDAHARLLRHPQRARAPPTADLEHVLARLQLSAGDHRIQLGVLRILEQLLLLREVEALEGLQQPGVDGRRVHQRVVEEELRA